MDHQYSVRKFLLNKRRMWYKGSHVSVNKTLYRRPSKQDDVYTYTSLRVPFNERPILYLLWHILSLFVFGSSLCIVLIDMEYKTDIATFNICWISNIIVTIYREPTHNLKANLVDKIILGRVCATIWMLSISRYTPYSSSMTPQWKEDEDQ